MVHHMVHHIPHKYQLGGIRYRLEACCIHVTVITVTGDIGSGVCQPVPVLLQRKAGHAHSASADHPLVTQAARFGITFATNNLCSKQL